MLTTADKYPLFSRIALTRLLGLIAAATVAWRAAALALLSITAISTAFTLLLGLLAFRAFCLWLLLLRRLLRLRAFSALLTAATFLLLAAGLFSITAFLQAMRTAEIIRRRLGRRAFRFLFSLRLCLALAVLCIALQRLEADLAHVVDEALIRFRSEVAAAGAALQAYLYAAQLFRLIAFFVEGLYFQYTLNGEADIACCCRQSCTT